MHWMNIMRRLKVMLLTELEYQSDMIKKALNDGVETTEQYEFWLSGYTSGYTDRQEEIIERMKSEVSNL